MPINPRVVKAFRAMRDIGIPEEKVKPILKNLLKLYDKNWDPIEEENYRVLADAIFENEEEASNSKKKKENTEASNSTKKKENAASNSTKKKENAEASNSTKKKEKTEQGEILGGEALPHGEAERPLKRLRLRYQDQASDPATNSPHSAGPLIRPKDEPVELPDPTPLNNANRRNESVHISTQSLDKSKGKQPISPNSLETCERTRNSQTISLEKSQTNIPKVMEPVIVPRQMSPGNKGKEILPHQFASSERRLEFENSSRALFLQKTAVVPFLVQPKEEPFIGDFPECLPLAVIHPETSNGENSSIDKSLSRKQSDADGVHAFSSETGTNVELATISNESSSQLQVASTPLGEVKISLSCNVSSLRPDFHTPTLDDVVKLVEARCLQSYKILDQNFSVKKLMKDMCECFLELGSESYQESGETGRISPGVDILGKASSGDPSVGGGMLFDDLNVSDNVQSDTAGDSPKMLPPSPNREPDKEASHCNGEVIVDTDQDNLDDTTCKSLVVVKQHEFTPDQIHSLQYVFDISKGQERVAVMLERGQNDSLPSFHYIPQNAVFQNAHVNFSLARIGDDNCSTCVGDCLSSPMPCLCAAESGGAFAYTVEGLVREEFLDECISMNRDPQKHCQYFCKDCPLERSKNGDAMEPCKGHLVRKFIKECWLKCGCGRTCGNRVVQRGITRNLQVFVTEGKGWGLRTLEDLPKGSFVCEYVGEILTNAELFDRVSRNPKGEVHSYPVLLDADWGCEGVLKDEEALCLDATFYGNVARFINHRCFDSNMVEIPVEIETPDHHYYHLAFFTTRKVHAMEELTWDYGIDFDDVEHPVKAFRCHCNSRFCRNIKRPIRSRPSSRR